MQTTLTDFGLSQAVSSTTLIGTKTMMAGSPGFQAPELLHVESLGPHCEVYAFGCVLIVLAIQGADSVAGAKPILLQCVN